VKIQPFEPDVGNPTGGRTEMIFKFKVFNPSFCTETFIHSQGILDFYTDLIAIGYFITGSLKCFLLQLRRMVAHTEVRVH